MSVRSLTTLAVARDHTKYRASVIRPADDGDCREDQSFTAALTSVIPTEPLAAYTGFVGIIAALKSQGGYLPLRWSAYGAFLLLVIASVQVSYHAKAAGPGHVDSRGRSLQRSMPVPEILSAALAAAAWGLIMPGSALQARLSGNTSTIVTACILFGGGALVALLAPTLMCGSNIPKTARTPRSGRKAAVAAAVSAPAAAVPALAEERKLS